LNGQKKIQNRKYNKISRWNIQCTIRPPKTAAGKLIRDNIEDIKAFAVIYKAGLGTQEIF
jgi:hypothetical protein